MQPIQSFGDLLCLVPCRGRGRRGLPTPQAWHLHSELDKVEGGDCGGDLPGPGFGGGGGVMIYFQDQNLDVVEKKEDGEEEPTSCFVLGLLLPGSLPVGWGWSG